MSIIIVLVLLTILSAMICYSVAVKRGSDTTFWVVLAVLIGPFALPFVFFSKSKAI